MMERLQKVLAHAGIASRRKAEEYIEAGRVSVDGKVVRELGVKVDPEESIIKVDGQKLKLERPLYFLVNKPRGFVCTNAFEGRHRVLDLFPTVEQRLFTVGRLDADSEGLLIVTNDGELANRLAHPRYEISKVYIVEIDGGLNQAEVAKLKKGIHIAEGIVRFSDVHVRHAGRDRSVVRVVLKEGLNREIRRAFAALEKRVRRLKRVQIGRVKDDDLKSGTYRKLTSAELQMLREDSGMNQRER